MRIRVASFLMVLGLAAGPALGAVPELRGMWIHGPQIKTAAEADAVVAKLDRAHLNAAFVLVWYWGGQTYFQSTLCPMAEGVPTGYDPLGYMVQQCHKRGIQVHAWFVNGAYGAAEVHAVLDKHPDWAVQDSTGTLWYDFSKPEVRRFESDLMIECLRKYNLDGLQFDYIRYGPHQCYCDYCQSTFARRYGFTPLTRERRTQYPAGVTITANPLVKPTTALVMAEFYDGTPALALNKLGRGAALLLNWHAENEMPPAVAETVKLMLRVWTTGGTGSPPPVYLATTAVNRAEYGGSALESARATLTRLGCRPAVIPLEQIERQASGSIVVLPAVYLISENTAAALERFVRRGGRLLFFDGPTKSIRLAALQRVTGFAAGGRYLHRDDVIRSTGRSPLAPQGDHPMNLWDWKRRMAKWAEFRKLGVTELVQDVYRRAKGLKPNVLVSAAVKCTLESADAAYQEWPRWLRGRTIDFVIPMAYSEDTSDLAHQLAQWKTVDPSLQRIIPGLSLYQDSAGQSVTRNLELIRRQRSLCRQQGAHGNLYFSMEYLNVPLATLFRTEFYPLSAPPYFPPSRLP